MKSPRHPALSAASLTFVNKLAQAGSRRSAVHSCLLAFGTALSSPPPKLRCVPTIAQRVLRDSNPAELSSHAFRGSGAFRSIGAHLIRQAVPHPLNDQFCITALRDYLQSEHGIGRVMASLAPEVGIDPQKFLIVLGVLRGVSRAVCRSWLRLVIQHALSALTDEANKILAASPRPRKQHAASTGPTPELLARIENMHASGVSSLPRDAKKTAQYRRQLLARMRPAFPLENITNVENRATS
ncbi:hypothetical protein C8R46DRAFT_1253306 [Mycena filopes]|nr:hypothetical protein C8R46DRAFT_1253306 [Mycena filopes]